MTNIYCGSKTPSKNQRKGTAKECAKAGRICLYGLHKINSKELENIKSQKKLSKQATNEKGKLLTKLGALSGKIRKEERNKSKVKNKEELKKLEKEISNLKIEYNVISNKLKKYMQKRESTIKRNSKRLTRRL